MKITFINEIADLCEQVGANVQEVARGIGLDNRIGSKFLHAGPGYGGSCFPKDTLALVKTAQDAGVPLRIVETVVAVNDARKRAMAAQGDRGAGRRRRAARRSALLGLTFKPNTDDMRDSPVARHRPRAAGRRAPRCGRSIPRAWPQAKPLLPNVTYCAGPYAGRRGRRRAGDRHRMGRLPRARPRPAEEA